MLSKTTRPKLGKTRMPSTILNKEVYRLCIPFDCHMLIYASVRSATLHWQTSGFVHRDAAYSLDRDLLSTFPAN